MKENRNEFTSVIGGVAMRVIFEKKPSMFIPFKGDFPLVKNYDQIKVIETLQETRLVKDLPEDIQNIVIKGSRMTEMEASFIEDLKNAGIDFNAWMELDNGNKADLLVGWLEKNNLSYESLKIG